MKDVIKIKKPNQVSSVKVSHEASSYYANLSKQWAIKLDKPVEEGEYSSKYYAKISEQYANSANKSAMSAEIAASNLEKFVINSLYFPELKISNEDTILNNLEREKRSTFDKSKFTITGNPTITDDGVARGFGSGNYINANIPNFTASSNLTMILPKVKSSDVSASYNNLSEWGAANNGIKTIFYFNNNQMTLGFYNGATQVFIYRPSITNNTYYQPKFVWDGSQLKTYLKTGDSNFELVNTSSLTGSLSFTDDHAYIGCNRATQQPAINCSIDLKPISITVDGKEVFNGNETGIDIIKADNYEVVGSPVISDDGVVSGFNHSNFIKTPNVPELGKITESIRFTSSFVYNTISAEQTIWNKDLNFDFRLNGGSIILRTYDGSKSNTFSILQSQHKVANGEQVFCDVVITPNLCRIKINGVEYTKKQVTDFSYLINAVNKVFRIGMSNALDLYFQTSIDLNSFKIYVDGNLAYQPCLKIPYTQSKTGFKIVDGGYRDRVQDMYEQYGYTHYYTLGYTDFTLATCKGSDVVESGDNYEQTADLTLKQWGSATSGQTVNLLPYKDTNYAVTLANSSKTKNSFIANATGDYWTVGKTVLG